jgi:hypothetical protein
MQEHDGFRGDVLCLTHRLTETPAVANITEYEASKSSETSEPCSTHQKTAEFTVTDVQTSNHTCSHLSLSGMGKCP